MILQIEELISKEADLIQETENFRRRTISIFREIQEEIENIQTSQKLNMQ